MQGQHGLKRLNIRFVTALALSEEISGSPGLPGYRAKRAKFRRKKWVMKSTWEEELPPASSPPSEVEVLKILLEAKLRGLPQPYALDSAIVRDDDLEVETRSFPENCEVALLVSTNLMVKVGEPRF